MGRLSQAEDLAAAGDLQETKYEDMKLRIQFMYENAAGMAVLAGRNLSDF